MKRVRMFLLGCLVLVLALTASVRTSRAQGGIFCQLCAMYGDCFDCCRCDGGTATDCALLCG